MRKTEKEENKEKDEKRMGSRSGEGHEAKKG